MSDIFISYARSTATQAQQVAEALRALGYGVWRDDELPAHRTYGEVIEERLRAAKAVVVVWSADAAKSQWVRAEADVAREAGSLVQLSVDGTIPPLPFNQIQCAEMTGWSGDLDAPGWRKVAASIADLAGGSVAIPPPVADTPLPLPSKPSIAVMPFANLSGDPEQEYFADGMVAEITNALSRFKSLFVIASSSTLSFKGNAVSAQEVSRRLGVRFVLEGSVRKAGERVRIAVQLIDAADGAQVWANRFDDTLDDIFALQDKVALGVAGKIEPTVWEAEIRRASARPTENMSSYDLYLRAMPLRGTFDKAGMLAALALLNRAIALDPNFGPALGSVASCHYFIDTYGWSDDLEANRRRGIEMAHRALKVAGEDAGVIAHAAVAIATLERDLDAAIALVDRAIELNPGASVVWAMSGIVRLRVGDVDVAIAHLETSMRLNPTGMARQTQNVFMARARFQQRRFSEVIALAKEVTQQTDNPSAYAYLAASYGHLGETSAALAALARYRTLTPLSTEAFARSTLHDPAHLKLFLDGIALAEGKAATDGSAAD